MAQWVVLEALNLRLALPNHPGPRGRGCGRVAGIRAKEPGCLAATSAGQEGSLQPITSRPEGQLWGEGGDELAGPPDNSFSIPEQPRSGKSPQFCLRGLKQSFIPHDILWAADRIISKLPKRSFSSRVLWGAAQGQGSRDRGQPALLPHAHSAQHLLPAPG